ncbi:hypothetical protein E2320_017782 [Naja naja]|nr:hypothetical protein E2320_017782 [Naja naja]
MMPTKTQRKPRAAEPGALRVLCPDSIAATQNWGQMESPAKNSEPLLQALLPRNLKESQRREKEIEKKTNHRKGRGKKNVCEDANFFYSGL